MATRVTDHSLTVAMITRDHLYEKWQREGGNQTDGYTSEVGREFSYGAMATFWGWDDIFTQGYYQNKPKRRFKLYDDDGELYYTGWLLDDDETIVQQFVLRWAESDSGCTTTKVVRNGELVQDLG